MRALVLLIRAVDDEVTGDDLRAERSVVERHCTTREHYAGLRAMSHSTRH
jgi:hypothetical protein